MDVEMCGITGLWELKRKTISQSQIEKFNHSLSHRGPDGEKTYKDLSEQLFLGHTRLSILDVTEKGSQPMSDFSHRFWITFNGEIYNFLELRKELIDLGYYFQSESDTEVLLLSYIEWGEDCQLKFNGMWAFGIWDSLKKELFLSRDRFGVKPLYFFSDPNYFVFASELKAFWKIPELNLRIDELAVANVIADGNCLESTENTWIQQIRRLRGGYCLVFSKEKGLKTRKWWNTLDHLPSVPRKWEDQVELFSELFFDACKIRSRSDVPTATALSGGLDSSSVLAAISHFREKMTVDEARISKNWRHVFSALFSNTSQDESVYVRQMADFSKAELFSLEITPESFVEHLDQAIFDLEEIFDLPVGPWSLYKEFRRQNTVISIDGHGADELLGGYPHYVEDHIQDFLFRKFDLSRVSELKQILEKLYPEDAPIQSPSNVALLKKSSLETLSRVSPKVYTLLKSCYRRFRFARSATEYLQIAPMTHEYGKELKKDLRFKTKSLLFKSLYIDFHERTLPTILRNFDRCSMAHGVEIRAPFMDWRLVTYAFSLPDEAKIGGGFTKRILREATKGLLPESIRTRTTKIGFANPVIEWLKKSLKGFILDQVSSKSFQESSIWDGKKILFFVEKAYQNQDLKSLRSVWELVQANRLIELFKA